MDVGDTLKKFRTAKNIRMNDVADETISQPFLSRVERGESDISVSRLNHLLQELHVTPVEFFAAANSTPGYQDPDDAYFGYFPQLMLDSRTVHDVNLLKLRLAKSKILLAKVRSEYQIKPSQWRLITWRSVQLFVNRIYYHLDPSKIGFIDVAPIQSYLLNLDSWTLMDVIVFSFFADQLNSSVKLRLLKSMSSHIPNSGVVQSWSSIMTSIVFSLFQQFMVANKIDFAYSALNIMEDIRNQFSHTDDEITLLFMRGWLQYAKNGQEKNGIRQMNDAVSILAILKYTQAAKEFRQLIDQIIGNDPTPIVGDAWFN
ncbi:hypothetical protein FC91_GL001348 [Schleiferilactobacillus harbinensis DSM 16991]|uniref:HTH cro/C1-type domain-containing protein n=2 Tax=Schleiferilactobacillus harbinensis TaxID=304207 RepID=A0A0R1X4X0_9LACO|nr:hypothetical protein FC91_GL001348 [Schleiferilactobacillus harbinensis DSM 16991]